MSEISKVFPCGWTRCLSMKILSLNDDVFLKLCLDLLPEPHVLIMFITALNVKRSERFWEEIWMQHRILVQSKRLAEKFFMSPEYKGRVLPRHYEQIMRLSYSRQCDMCHSRKFQSVDNKLKMRLCWLCKQDNYISNWKLYYEYGISAHDVVHGYGRFIRYSPLHKFKHNEEETHAVYSDFAKFIMMFWKPDLEKCYDLPFHRLKQRQRLVSINVLVAVFRRHYARGKDYLCLRLNEMRRIMTPYRDKSWFPGSNNAIFTTGRICDKMEQKYVMPFVAPTEFHLKLVASRSNLSVVEFRRHVRQQYNHIRYQWWSNDQIGCEVDIQ